MYHVPSQEPVSYTDTIPGAAAARRLRLTPEPLDELLILRVLGVEHLHGHLAPKLDVLCA